MLMEFSSNKVNKKNFQPKKYFKITVFIIFITVPPVILKLADLFLVVYIISRTCEWGVGVVFVRQCDRVIISHILLQY